MGRKKMDSKDKKAAQLLIRLGEDQKAKYEKAAKTKDLSLSVWIRRTLDQKAIEETGEV